MATFWGLMPLNIVHLRTGLILSEVNHIGGFDFKQIGWLMLLGLVALIPTMFKKKLEHAFDKDDHKEPNQVKDDNKKKNSKGKFTKRKID